MGKWDTVLKVLKVVGTVVVIAILLYLVASYIDVITHNLTTMEYQDWNFFTIFVELYERYRK